VRSDDLPLLTWRPPTCHLIPFPLVRRIGKVRDVARKMLDKSTDRHADFYRTQVTDALLKHLEKIGLPESEQEEQLSAFWTAVDFEIARLKYRTQRRESRQDGPQRFLAADMESIRTMQTKAEMIAARATANLCRQASADIDVE
jgi:hypothetical protein